jgi:hypothetical protein
MIGADHTRAFEEFDKLGDEDLLAIIGSEWSYGEPESHDDELFFQVRIRKTQEAIERGAERLQEYLRDAKREVCRQWAETKNRDTVGNAEKFVLVFEVLCRLKGIDPGAVTPATIMFCRSVNYGFDRLCARGSQ